MDFSMIWENLSWNVFSEIIGIILTVFFIDFFAKQKEKKRWRPLQGHVYAKIIRTIDTFLDNFDIRFRELDMRWIKYRDTIIDAKYQVRFPTLYSDEEIGQWVKTQQSIQNNNVPAFSVYTKLGSEILELTVSYSYALEPEFQELLLTLSNTVDDFQFKYSTYQFLKENDKNIVEDKNQYPPELVEQAEKSNPDFLLTNNIVVALRYCAKIIAFIENHSDKVTTNLPKAKLEIWDSIKSKSRRIK